jgi:hypothetical protein
VRCIPREGQNVTLMRVPRVSGHDRENDMRFLERGIRTQVVSAFGMCALALTLDAARAAEDKTYVMKITLPTINNAPHQFAKNYAAAVEKDSGGRIKAEVSRSSPACTSRTRRNT